MLFGRAGWLAGKGWWDGWPDGMAGQVGWQTGCVGKQGGVAGSVVGGQWIFRVQVNIEK